MDSLGAVVRGSDGVCEYVTHDDRRIRIHMLAVGFSLQRQAGDTHAFVW